MPKIVVCVCFQANVVPQYCRDERTCSLVVMLDMARYECRQESAPRKMSHAKQKKLSVATLTSLCIASKIDLRPIVKTPYEIFRMTKIN